MRREWERLVFGWVRVTVCRMVYKRQSWSKVRRPLSAVLFSSIEPVELSQWLYIL